MLFPKAIVVLLLVCNLYVSCKKTEETAPAPPTLPPATTPVGSPVGNPVSKVIGSEGGSLISPDNRLRVEIPAGALSASTSITIQPVTNESPGGIGLSYHLLPDGIQFNKPVNLVYHYTEEEVRGTHPYLLYIAYQDSLHQWRADHKKRVIDTIAKTVTLPTDHFSIWSMGDRIRYYYFPFDDEMHANETRSINVVWQDPPVDSDDETPPLPTQTRLADNAVGNWKVNGHNGNSADGTITASGNNATYKAPADIPVERTVQISAEIKYTITLFNNGHPAGNVNRFILFVNFKLLPSVFEFTVKTHFKDAGVSGFVGQVYEDKSTFEISLAKMKDAQGLPAVIATASNYQNQPPTVTPATQVYPTPTGTFTWTWTPDGIGETNVTDISLEDFNDSIVTIRLKHTGTLAPGFNWSSTNPNLSGSLAPQPLGGNMGVPDVVRIKLRKERQAELVNGHPWIEIIPR